MIILHLPENVPRTVVRPATLCKSRSQKPCGKDCRGLCTRKGTDLAAALIERSDLSSGPAVDLQVRRGGLKTQPRRAEIWGLEKNGVGS